MKLLTYRNSEGESRLGILINNRIHDAAMQDQQLPNNMLAFLNMGEKGMDLMKEAERLIQEGKAADNGVAYSGDVLLAPIPNPTSCRDGYAFRQHVEAARRNRGVAMIPEFDEYPIMYFTNHNAIQGPGEIWCMPDHFQKLDFELEAAVVLGKK
ncbi:MAG TPA: fumarylacetoacetate hydrolase family protein, partial [Bacteroidia bacterium]